MLTEERHRLILEKLEREAVVYLSDLITYLDTSESTIRRDLNSLHKAGLLKKVHGGATPIEDKANNTKDEYVKNRKLLNIDDKVKIAKKAAGLIKADDFVYLDAGTTVELMIDFINEKNALFVTNGIDNAKKLLECGCTTHIIGGELKISTEAIVGVEAVNSLRKYNFTKGFFGVNGINEERGYTTPDIKEALVKKEALSRCKESFILADSTKFNKISSVVFADISEGKIITTNLKDNNYKEVTTIIEV